MILEKDRMLFGTKIYNYNTKELGLVLYTWKNKFADAELDFATCVNEYGRRYNVKLDEIRPLEDFEEDELRELGIKL